MTVNSYYVGNVVQIYAKFYAADGVTPADPSTITLKVMDPTGVLTPQTTNAGLSGSGITFVSTGYYTFNLLVNKPGTWFYRWEGGGAVVAAYDNQIIVTDSPLK